MPKEITEKGKDILLGVVERLWGFFCCFAFFSLRKLVLRKLENTLIEYSEHMQN